MGGTSASSFEVQEGEFLVWSGTVEIVSYLDSPGFCILQTANDDNNDFMGIGEQVGISFFVEKSTMGTMLQPMSAQLTNGAISSTNDAIITYEGKLQVCGWSGKVSKASDGETLEMVELFAPWDEFKPTFRGFEVDGPALTPEELDKTYRIVSTVLHRMFIILGLF